MAPVLEEDKKVISPRSFEKRVRRALLERNASLDFSGYRIDYYRSAPWRRISRWPEGEIEKYLKNNVRLPWLDRLPGDSRVLILNGLDLQRADLRGADLRDVDLRGTDMQGADLRGAVLIRLDPWGGNQTPDLRNTKLRGAKITREQIADYVRYTPKSKQIDFKKAGVKIVPADDSLEVSEPEVLKNQQPTAATLEPRTEMRENKEPRGLEF